MIHLLELENVPIYQQLKLEEALLRADKRNWCIINRGTSPAIVMGISGKPEVLINQKRLQEEPVDLIKRFSGGGTVFVDESTLFISFICNSDELGVPCFPSQVLCWTKRFYEKVVPGFAIRENDYVIGDKKFGGNAQYLQKNRWLHHSTLLWDFCPAKMSYLLMPPKMPGYRKMRSHEEFLIRLREAHPCEKTFLERFKEELNGHYIIVESRHEEAMGALKLPHRSSTTFL